MKDKIRRAKEFLNRHSDAYMWTCGAITGAAVVFVAMHDKSHTTTLLKLSAADAKDLMQDEELHGLFELPKQTIALKITQ